VYYTACVVSCMSVRSSAETIKRLMAVADELLRSEGIDPPWVPFTEAELAEAESLSTRGFRKGRAAREQPRSHCDYDYARPDLGRSARAGGHPRRDRVDHPGQQAAADEDRRTGQHAARPARAAQPHACDLQDPALASAI
jgi:hypothetical protein